MKISEIIVESRADIDLLLRIKGHEVAMIRRRIIEEIEIYQGMPIKSHTSLRIVKGIILEYLNIIHFTISEFLPNSFHDDVDFISTIDEFAALDNEIRDKLRSLR